MKYVACFLVVVGCLFSGTYAVYLPTTVWYGFPIFMSSFLLAMLSIAVGFHSLKSEGV